MLFTELGMLGHGHKPSSGVYRLLLCSGSRCAHTALSEQAMKGAIAFLYHFGILSGPKSK